MPEITVGEILLTLGLTLFVGYFVKRIMGRLKVPDVTGYIILGVLAGAFVFSRFEGLLDSLEIISDFALAIIAFIIGHELKRDVIKKLGKAILFIAVFEAFGAFFTVFSVLYFFNFFPLHTSLLLASIASATAPAATVYVIHQYKSEGPLTSTILAVVGIDDAIALIIYVFASTVAKQTFHSGSGTVFNFSMILMPVLSIFSSGVLGVVGGFLFRFLFKNIRNRDALAMGIVGFVLIVMGGAELLGISELLSVMVFSAFLTNTSVSLSRRSGEIIESFTSIMLPFFFIFAGAHLDVTKISSIAVVCLVYFFARSIGKIGGASIGGILGNAPSVVKKFTGLGLIPQVGVAVALALAVKRTFGDPNTYGDAGADMAAVIINILLCSTIITESIGPVLTKFALKKSGETQVD